MAFEAEGKISLFIIGAQKAGTTSLKQYLGEHPQLITHLQKEFAFFYDETEYSLGESAAFRKYFGRGTTNKKIIAKNAGLYVNEAGLSRLKQHNPDCKIVLILRNPVERAYSAFQMETNYGNYSGKFEDLKDIIQQNAPIDWRYDFFIRMGMYADHLEVLLKYFPLKNITLIKFEELSADPQRICTQIFKSLGVDESFKPDTSIKYNVTRKMRSSNYARFVMRLLKNSNPIKRVVRKIIPSGQDYKIGEMLRNVNKSQHKPEKISIAMQQVLTEFYKPYNDRLTNLSGMDFSAWNNPNTRHHEQS